MKRLLSTPIFVLLAAFVALPTALRAQVPDAGDLERYRADADRIIDAALSDSAAYARLAKLTDTFGHRLSGSRSLEAAIDWIIAEMKRDGLDNVRGEKVMVPHWVRGRESAMLTKPRSTRLHMIGLGGSIGTPPTGITAPVLVVRDFADLEARKADARGKIVLFDVPFTNYGQTVRYRGDAASAAARVGAVAALIRSVSSYSIQNPHTGSMRYDSTVKKIPAAALSVEDAMMLHRFQDRGDPIVVKLSMEARTLPDVPSRNVMGEIAGSERPEEVVVLGGHIDSWDVGQGAMDDGGGVVAAWEAVRLIKALGLKPRRTIRAVGWTNEENGLRGGNGYRDAHRAEIDNHVLAIESDGGVFKPLGFGFAGPDTAAALAILKRVGALLARVGSTEVRAGGGGADIGPLLELGVPGLGLNVDGSRYFWFHHSDGDTMDKLDPLEMAQCVATMAVMAYVVADMPEKLPRVRPVAAR